MPSTPTRPPVSPLLKEAAELGLDVKPGWLPVGCFYLFGAVYPSLPASMPRQARKLAGLDVAISLCEARRGVRIPPGSVDACADPIALCLRAHGLEPDALLPAIMVDLAGVCAGGLQIPPLRQLAKTIRNHRIRQEHAAGVKLADLAAGHGMTARQIRNIL